MSQPTNDPHPASSHSGEAERGEPEAPYEHPLEPTGRITATTRWVELPSDLPDDSAPSLPEGDDGEPLLRAIEAAIRAVHHDASVADHPAMKDRVDSDVAGILDDVRAYAAARLTEQHQVEVDREWWKNVAAEAAKQLKDAEKREKHAREALEKIVAYIDVSGDRDDNPEDCINDVSEMAKVAVSEMAKAALTSLRSGGGA